MTKKRNFLIFFLFICVLSIFVGCSASTNNDDDNNSGTKDLVLATAGTSGTTHPIGVSMSKIINDNEPSLNITAQSTGGSVENIKLMDNNEVEIGLVNAYVSSEAFEGEGDFEEEEEVSALFSAYSQPFHIVVLEDSDIKSIDDLKGKKVGVGAPGSGAEVLNKQILDELGITYDDFDPELVGFDESVDGMKNGQIDASMIGAGYPVAAIMDLAATDNIRLIPFSEEELDAVVEKYDYLDKSVIPADTYEGVDETPSISVNNLVLISDDTDDEVAYNITKTLFENIDELRESHNALKDFDEESAIKDKDVIPMHPGAEKYFKEIDVID